MNIAINTPSAAGHPLFVAHPTLWPQLSGYVRPKLCNKDEVILHHGDAAGSLWLVIKGWVKLTRQTPDGKESIVGLCAEGDMFGEAALFAHTNYPYHAQALVADTELLAIPSDVIRRLIGENTALSNTVMSMLNERNAQAQLKLEHMSTMSAAQRLGCFFLRLCHAQGKGSKTLIIPVEKNILASYLGMKPETFSRSQQQLKTVGIEVNGPQVTISDITKLATFVCGSCSESGYCESEEANN